MAFEIPLDGLVPGRKSVASSTGELAHSSSSKLSLPKLNLSNKDLQEKLANTEARWKVGAQLDRILSGVGYISESYKPPDVFLNHN